MGECVKGFDREMKVALSIKQRVLVTQSFRLKRKRKGKKIGGKEDKDIDRKGGGGGRGEGRGEGTAAKKVE